MLTVVTGPPCAGKTTYVRARAQPGDVVIDFDNLAQAFGSPVRHGHNDAIRHVTMMARRTAIEAAVTTHCGGATVWIVDCNITASRARLYEQAGAEIVALGAEPAELHRRAKAERPALWHKLIDAWQAPAVAVTARAPSTQRVGSREW